MISDTNRQHEIDRLRLLLQKATGARKALMVEIEAGERGFRIIATGVSVEHELQAMQMVADYLNILLRGAIRFSLAAIDGISSGAWQSNEKHELAALATAVGTSPDALAPVPEEPPSVDAVDPVLASSVDPSTREKESSSSSNSESAGSAPASRTSD